MNRVWIILLAAAWLLVMAVVLVQVEETFMDQRRKTYRLRPSANCVEARRHWDRLIRQYGSIYWLAFNDELRIWVAKLVNGKIINLEN
jgi:hypothetical protein